MENPIYHNLLLRFCSSPNTSSMIAVITTVSYSRHLSTPRNNLYRYGTRIVDILWVLPEVSYAGKLTSCRYLPGFAKGPSPQLA